MPDTPVNATDRPLASTLNGAMFSGTVAGVFHRIDGGLAAASLGVALNDDNASDFSLNNADHPPGTWITPNNGSPLTLTVPNDATFSFPIGCQIPIMRRSAQITIAPGSGVTIRFANNNRSKFTAIYSVAFLWKINAGEWVFYGDTSSS